MTVKKWITALVCLLLMMMCAGASAEYTESIRPIIVTGYRDWDEFYGNVSVDGGVLHFTNFLQLAGTAAQRCVSFGQVRR